MDDVLQMNEEGDFQPMAMLSEPHAGAGAISMSLSSASGADPSHAMSMSKIFQSDTHSLSMLDEDHAMTHAHALLQQSQAQSQSQMAFSHSGSALISGMAMPRANAMGAVTAASGRPVPSIKLDTASARDCFQPCGQSPSCLKCSEIDEPLLTSKLQVCARVCACLSLNPFPDVGMGV